MIINRKKYATKTSSVNGVTNYVTNIHDEIRDNRSPVVKTPKRPWRPPTYWRRGVWSGQVMSYGISGRVSFDTTLPEHIEVVFHGDDDLSGYFHEPVTPYRSDLQKRAETIALLKLKRQNVNLAQAFAERKQTARLVQNNLVRVARTVRELRRGDLSGALKALGLKRGKRSTLPSRFRPEAASDMWLEIQYGWKPLLSDIHGAVQQHHEIEAEGSRLIATVTGTAKDKTRREGWKPQAGQVNSVEWFVKKRIDNEQKVKVRLDYVRTDPVPWDLLTQLGLTNPFSVLWEVVPFSFVVDWSLPLGEYFSLLDAAAGWELKGGSISRKTTDIIRVTEVKLTPKSGGIYSNWSGYATPSGIGRQMNFERTVVTESPVPPPPSFDTGASHLHVANGLALLSSAFLAKSIKIK